MNSTVMIQLRSRLESTPRLLHRPAPRQRRCKQLNSRPLTRPNNKKEAVREARPVGQLAVLFSEQSAETPVQALRLEPPLEPCVAAESNERPMQRPKTRLRKMRTLSYKVSTVKPKPLITKSRVPSSEDSQHAWRRETIRLSNPRT